MGKWREVKPDLELYLLFELSLYISVCKKTLRPGCIHEHRSIAWLALGASELWNNEVCTESLLGRKVNEFIIWQSFANTLIPCLDLAVWSILILSLVPSSFPVAPVFPVSLPESPDMPVTKHPSPPHQSVLQYPRTRFPVAP